MLDFYSLMGTILFRYRAVILMYGASDRLELEEEGDEIEEEDIVRVECH